jgi:hypothetical protein
MLSEGRESQKGFVLLQYWGLNSGPCAYWQALSHWSHTSRWKSHKVCLVFYLIYIAFWGKVWQKMGSDCLGLQVNDLIRNFCEKELCIHSEILTGLHCLMKYWDLHHLVGGGGYLKTQPGSNFKGIVEVLEFGQVPSRWPISPSDGISKSLVCIKVYLDIHNIK